eukprot:s202_g15.t1
MCRAQAGAPSCFPSPPPTSMVDIWVHPRHGGLQEMILKERKWTAKAIQQRRSLQKDEKEAKIVEVLSSESKVQVENAPAQKEALERAGSSKAVETASLLKSRNGCLLPTNVSIGPAAYYTGCGRHIR